MIFPGEDEALDVLETGEDPKLQGLVLSFCSEMAASFPPSDVLDPGDSCTLIWRNGEMICSGLNIVFGMIGTLVQVNSLNQSGPIPTRQFVTIRSVIQDQIRALERDDAVRAFSYASPDLP